MNATLPLRRLARVIQSYSETEAEVSLLHRAESQRQHGDFRAAAASLAEALLALGPAHAERPLALALLAFTYLRLGRRHDAIRRGLDALALHDGRTSHRGACGQ